MSAEREKYLRRVRRDRRVIAWARALLLTALVVAWETATRVGALDPFIFSSPSRVARTIGMLFATGDLMRHILVTLWETVAGFAIGMALGVGAAVLLWWFPRLGKVIDPYLVVLNSLPKIALGPVLIVWMGTGMPAIVTIAVLVSVVVAISSVYVGFSETSAAKLTLLRSFGATKRQMLTKVVLPSNVPVMVSALKLTVGMSWVGVIVGEFLISRAGLGYLIVYGGQVFKLDIVMSAVTILCALAGGMYWIVALCEKAVYRRSARTP